MGGSGLAGAGAARGGRSARGGRGGRAPAGAGGRVGEFTSRRLSRAAVRPDFGGLRKCGDNGAPSASAAGAGTQAGAFGLSGSEDHIRAKPSPPSGGSDQRERGG